MSMQSKTIVKMLLAVLLIVAADVFAFKAPVLAALVMLCGTIYLLVLLIRKQFKKTAVFSLVILTTLAGEAMLHQLTDTQVQKFAQEIASLKRMECEKLACPKDVQKYSRLTYIVKYYPSVAQKGPTIIFDQYGYKRKEISLQNKVLREWQFD